MYSWKLKFNSWFCSWKRNRDHKKWLSLREKLKTPYDIHDYFLNNNFSYTEKHDKPFDNVQRPDQFIVNKSGDCDDFANFTYEVLKYHGYNVEMWLLFSRNYGHAVTLIKQKERVNIYDVQSNQSFMYSFIDKWSALQYTMKEPIIKENCERYKK